MKRYRDDSVKPGQGIDRNKGAGFTSDPIDPWTAQSNHEEREPYSRNRGSSAGDKFIERGSQFSPRRVDDFMFRAQTRDIYDDTCGDNGNSDVNGGFSGPIRYGVSKGQ
jgi:hypothetical protein